MFESGFPWRGSFPRPRREKVVPVGTRVKGLTPLPTNQKVLNHGYSIASRSGTIGVEAPVERYLLEQSGRYSRRGIDKFLECSVWKNHHSLATAVPTRWSFRQHDRFRCPPRWEHRVGSRFLAVLDKLSSLMVILRRVLDSVAVFAV